MRRFCGFTAAAGLGNLGGGTENVIYLGRRVVVGLGRIWTGHVARYLLDLKRRGRGCDGRNRSSRQKNTRFEHLQLERLRRLSLYAVHVLESESLARTQRLDSNRINAVENNPRRLLSVRRVSK